MEAFPAKQTIDGRQGSRLSCRIMLKVLEQLLVVQDRDQKIRRYQKELDVSPLERAQLEEDGQAADAQVARIKDQLQKLEVERNRLDLEANSKRDSIAKFKTQQMQTRKNEEYQALGHEITRFEDDVNRLEDRELEIMEESEKLSAKLKAAEADLSKVKESVRAQISGLEEKAEALANEIKKLEDERTALAADVDADVLDRYNRLMKSKGDRAVVAVEHGVCTGCHMKVTTTTALKARTGHEVVQCENCGRILYVGNG